MLVGAYSEIPCIPPQQKDYIQNVVHMIDPSSPL